MRRVEQRYFGFVKSCDLEREKMGSEVMLENFESSLGAYVRGCSRQFVDLEESFCLRFFWWGSLIIFFKVKVNLTTFEVGRVVATA